MPEHRGQRPRPRVGVVGAWSGEEEAALRVLFRAVTFHPTLADLVEEWSHQELDLVIVAEYAEGAGDGRPERLGLSPIKDVHLIVFGTPPPANVVPFHHGRTLHLGQPARSSEHIVGDPHGAVRRVLRRSMNDVQDVRGWPTISLLAMARPSAQLVQGSDIAEEKRKGKELLAKADELFRRSALMTAKEPDAPLGICTLREDTRTGIAWLPTVQTDRVAWIEALVQDWAAVDRHSFATILPWREFWAWMTALERALVCEAAGVEREREQVVTEFDRRRREIEDRLARARREADQLERALLTESGDTLVTVVVRILTELGFEVDVIDPTKAEGQPKAEDLRLRIPGLPGWEAIAEVKGHGNRSLRGADITKVNSHVRRYQTESGRWPDRVYLFYNGESSLPPDERHRPFEGDAEQVSALADQKWAVVPTVDLFRLYRDRALLDERAREFLAEAEGVFTYPRT